MMLPEVMDIVEVAEPALSCVLRSASGSVKEGTTLTISSNSQRKENLDDP